MIPYLFGKTESPLFGIYHPFQAEVAQDTGIVICNSVGHEYLRTHRLLGKLANLLNREGYHVFRFDYFGTGDSAGQFADATLSRWIEDTECATEELFANSGLDKIAFFGVRLGANIAASCSGLQSTRRLILWDPIIDGSIYLDELSLMHQKMLSDKSRFIVERKQSADQTDLIGYNYSEPLRNEIRQVNLDYGQIFAGGKNLLLSSQDTPIPCTQLMGQKGITCQTLAVDANWKEPESIEIMLQVSGITSAVISLLNQ